jgi:hypothetical protein
MPTRYVRPDLWTPDAVTPPASASPEARPLWGALALWMAELVWRFVDPRALLSRTLSRRDASFLCAFLKAAEALARRLVLEAAIRLAPSLAVTPRAKGTPGRPPASSPANPPLAPRSSPSDLDSWTCRFRWSPPAPPAPPVAPVPPPSQRRRWVVSLDDDALDVPRPPMFRQLPAPPPPPPPVPRSRPRQLLKRGVFTGHFPPGPLGAAEPGDVFEADGKTASLQSSTSRSGAPGGLVFAGRWEMLQRLLSAPDRFVRALARRLARMTEAARLRLARQPVLRRLVQTPALLFAEVRQGDRLLLAAWGGPPPRPG